jgi:phosphoribosylformylglycinamidine synthase
MAQLSGGAEIHLDRVPLKYSGLKPWEIFVSESQERMNLAVEPQHLDELLTLAEKYEVEATDIGSFTSSGFLDVRYGERRVAYLDLEFLHDGVPQKTMVAEWKKPDVDEPDIPDEKNYNDILLKLFGSLNICSREEIIRRYDHEVKGKTMIKPLMGSNGACPQDAAVMRLNFESFQGIAISNGIVPQYGDIDAYHMSAGAFDEAVRQIIAVGGKLPDPGHPDAGFWSVNDNFCVPDSAYHEKTNPDGKYKLAQLVRMCQALFDMATEFNIPMTSGKDSMKNDFVKEGVKISVPPTILYSMVAKVDDVRKTMTSDYKSPGDLIYLIGKTRDELGGSEFYRLHGKLGAHVPVVRKTDAIAIYRKMMAANDEQLIASCHDISNGGMAIALAESAFGNKLGVDIELERGDLSLNAILFSESHSRFIVSIAPDNRDAFETLMGAHCTFLGSVTEDPVISIKMGVESIVNIETSRLLNAWKNGLKF